MKLASFSHGGALSYGIVGGGVVKDVGAVLRAELPDLKSVLQASALDRLGAAAGQAPTIDQRDVQWLPVIANPDKVLCVGLNYEDQRVATGRPVVENPTVFIRFASSQTGHLSDLQMPHVSDRFDYEGELAVIIGQPGRYIDQAAAMAHVGGYACYNDGSLRDFQGHTSQFTSGKNFPHTGGFGPFMVTPDEVGPLDALSLQTRLNGDVVQHARLGEMIFDIAQIIAYCSSFTRLEPGDVIATGTPAGVGAQRSPPLWLKLGDTVEVEIERIGLLVNTVGHERLEG